MKIINGQFASESGFAVGVPLSVEPEPVLETELRYRLVGPSVAALQAMLDILEKSDAK